MTTPWWLINTGHLFPSMLEPGSPISSCREPTLCSAWFLLLSSPRRRELCLLGPHKSTDLFIRSLLSHPTAVRVLAPAPNCRHSAVNGKACRGQVSHDGGSPYMGMCPGLAFLTSQFLPCETTATESYVGNQRQLLPDFKLETP